MFHFSIISICDVYSFYSKGDSTQLDIHAPHPSTKLIVDMKLGEKHFVFVLFCCFLGQFPMEKYHLPLKLNLSYLISVSLDFGFLHFRFSNLELSWKWKKGKRNKLEFCNL